jgi:acyl-coenzyme A synthetase/AMP-(fatty) acid ligase
MQPPSTASLWESFACTGFRSGGQLWASDTTVALPDLATGSALDARLDDLRGRSVLLWASHQITAALALIEIAGIARRLVLCPPDANPAHLPYVIATADVDVVITDRPDDAVRGAGVERIVHCGPTIRGIAVDRTPEHDTEWILFTSGTTGDPKLVVHTLATLTGAIKPTGSLAGPNVWSTFYDIRRYGGLQIFLRALVGGGQLMLSAPGESATMFLTRAEQHGVTHLTGTPSHWRRALMSAAACTFSPAYARLSGEIADQAIIDHVQSAFPRAKVAHAFASTEAGVAFEVTDGCAGFPASLLEPNDSGVMLEVENETLRIRSSRTALRYLGRPESLLDSRGYVDSGDVVERRGDRYYFVGRRGGIINVGGLKIHPEEVEAVINRHPGVRMSRVSARKNPITGAVVAAEVVLAVDTGNALDTGEVESTKAEILASCRGALAAHKVPASIRIVNSLEVTPSGKLGRRDA